MMSHRLILSLIAALALVLAGCGGTIDDDYGYDSGEPGYPQYKDLTLILRVQDPHGYPIGDAKVYVDGYLDEYRTDPEFHPLGEGFPPAWRGWLANWWSDAYQVVMNYDGDTDRFEIAVSKPGWTDDVTLVRIDDYEPDHIFIRDVMVMYPAGAASTQSARAPHYAEVTAASGIVRPASSRPKTIIRATED